jgi:apolipoprotein N-acyltransferase
MRALALPLATVATCVVGGTLLLRTDTAQLTHPLPVAVIQTNVPPAYEWDRRYAERQLHQALQLTTQALTTDPRLVVWPENALSLYLDQEPLLLDTLQELARRRKVDLLIGGPRYARGRTYNSAYLLRARDGALQVYDKQRLVPFAEAPPLHPAEAARDESPGSFTAGHTAGLLRGQAALGVSICHEILYPEVIHPAVAAGAGLLVNIANDGWLDGGYGVASRQHFAMAVFRAVEARRFLVRAATTGISGVIDPWGRIVAASEPGAPRIVFASVESRRGTTPYVRYGDWFALACLLYAAGLAFAWTVPARHRAPVGIPAPSAS